ncbi:MAG: alkaline phosphatase [Planctomycetota bacterium]|nr:MAG: alkaline phosphatase [Planctomycetota bacterium]
MTRRIICLLFVGFACLALGGTTSVIFAQDSLRQLQQAAIEAGIAPFGHWGVNRDNYMEWGSHSNRLIPVYTFGTVNGGPGIDLENYTGPRSPYRSAAQLQRIYGFLPAATVDPTADWMDQTNIYDIQKAALAAGRKHIFLVVFDGMDWPTTRAAAIYKTRRIGYSEGRGTGLHFQDYTAGGETQFAAMVTSPHNTGTNSNVDTQTVLNPGGTLLGGYSGDLGGRTPWAVPANDDYGTSRNKAEPPVHAYTDSSSSASSMTAGLKTYNNAVNVDATGAPVQTIAHMAQKAGYLIGVVTSVPISHATPACAYAHNVDRDDFQDLTRDMLGLSSISHPEKPLPGVDVLIGAGFGERRDRHPKAEEEAQGANFVPGNIYLTDDDLHSIDVQQGGKYRVALRTAGQPGGKHIIEQAQLAAQKQERFLGYFGGPGGHLPFRTADGDYAPTLGRKKTAETYQPADLLENPTLPEMTRAALTVLEKRPSGFWLMVESGDVDWANHDNNIDNSIGAVLSGDDAVRVITEWVEKHSNWDESLMIVTADHGHYLVIDQPELLIPSPK